MSFAIFPCPLRPTFFEYNKKVPDFQPYHAIASPADLIKMFCADVSHHDEESVIREKKNRLPYSFKALSDSAGVKRRPSGIVVIFSRIHGKCNPYYQAESNPSVPPDNIRSQLRHRRMLYRKYPNRNGFDPHSDDKKLQEHN